MKIDRLLGILNIMANRDKVTVKELSERFEVSRRTIFRDIDTLNKSGIPITADYGVHGGVSIMKGYSYKNNIFSKSDIKNMFTALGALKSINNNEDIINLIAKVVPDEAKNIFSESDYLIDLSSWFKDSATMKKVSDLHEAIENNKAVCIEYISKNSRKMRIIYPHKIVFKQSYWYVYALCEENNEFRLFKTNRIVSYKILNKTFEKRKIDNIDFKDNFAYDLFDEEGSKDLYTVILEYDRKDEFFLTNKVDAKFFERKDNEAKGKIIFKVSDLDWAAECIITVIDKIKVVSPADLKEKMKLKINKMAEIYRDI